MKTVRLFATAFVIMFCTVAASAVELTVFAAASLFDALREISPLYARATGNTLRFNLGASGALARQIKEGAPADVFFSADELRIHQLEAAGLLLAGSRRSLLANTLVAVVAANDGAEVKALEDLATSRIRRVAIGEPATVPVGTYAKEHLEKSGMWTPLLRKIVPLDNVRAVLAAVEAGNADVGWVYRTDALSSAKVRIAIEVSRAEGPEIIYPVAIVKDSTQPETARELLDYLTGPEAQAVFARHGFLPAPADAR